MTDDIHAHLQVRDWVAKHGLDGVGLLIAHLSHDIYKGHGFQGHLARIRIRRNLWRYARECQIRLAESHGNATVRHYPKHQVGDVLNQGWLKSLAVLFSAACVGAVAAVLTASPIAGWLLLGFAVIFSMERWLGRYVNRHTASRWLYKLLLNLAILTIVVLLVRSATLLFSMRFGRSPVAGTVVFAGESVAFIWLWSVLRFHRRSRPAVKLTFLSVACACVVAAFAGVQPLTAYKDQVVQKGGTWLRSVTTAPMPPSPSAVSQSPLPSQSNLADKIKGIGADLWATNTPDFATRFNTYRQANGHKPLAFTDDLNNVAKLRLTEIQSDFDHNSTGGYNTHLAENIVEGISSNQEALDCWKGSPGHNANMLDSSYLYTGYACGGGHAVQVFTEWPTVNGEPQLPPGWSWR
jgi:uncharacterized protein YkwD